MKTLSLLLLTQLLLLLWNSTDSFSQNPTDSIRSITNDYAKRMDALSIAFTYTSDNATADTIEKIDQSTSQAYTNIYQLFKKDSTHILSVPKKHSKKIIYVSSISGQIADTTYTYNTKVDTLDARYNRDLTANPGHAKSIAINYIHERCVLSKKYIKNIESITQSLFSNFTNIPLFYDTLNHFIYHQKKDTFSTKKIDVNSTKSYCFQVSGINTAFYTVDFKPTFYKKKSSLPDQLKNYVPIITSSASPVTTPIQFQTIALTNAKYYTFNNQNYTEIDNSSLLIKSPTSSTNVFKNINTQYKLLFTIDSLTRNLIANAGVNSSVQDLKENIRSLFQRVYHNYSPETTSIHDSIPLIINKIYLDFTTNLNLYKTIFKASEKNYDTLFQLTEMESAVTANKDFILNCSAILNQMETNKHSKTSVLYPIEGDYLGLKISVKHDPFISKADTISKTLYVYKRNYFKFSFSGGFFASTLVTPNYTYTDSSGQYHNNIHSKADPSVGALVHYNYVAASWLKFGPVGGASVSFIDTKVKFLLGAGITIGRKNEVCISGGFCWGNVAHVIPDSNIGKPKAAYTPGKGVPTYDKFANGFFIGLTYNIFSN